jgi:RNA-directed DNA polymerase
MYKWQDLPWRKIERQVFKLQKRIYQASRRGDTKAVHKLQRLLLSSWSAKCLAVRRVTQDNRGKKTAGIDGVKSLTPSQRRHLAHSLRLSSTTKPVRRVWIPKPGKTEKRPLGIPIMQNRAEQALAKLALEPEWEAQFEPNSYGFRPGRSVHDAIEALSNAIRRQPKYVLDADIAACFDNISHTALLAKLNTFPLMRRAIRAWLKAGVMDNDKLFPTTAGSPQGGVISPLLANIALHGLETTVAEAHPQAKVIRYADDLVVLHRDLEVVKGTRQTVEHWLSDMGLKLNLKKTTITHTLTDHCGHVGLDFLGFHIRQHRVGKTHSGKTIDHKTIIKPSAAATRRHYQALKEKINANQTATQAHLISQLNPIIRGWTNYYATVSSSKTFARLSYLTYQKLQRWARRRHPHKSRHWWIGSIGEWKRATGPLGLQMESRFIVMTKHGSDGTSRCAEIRALMMVIGSTGQNGAAISRACLKELLSYSKGKRENALIVDCTLG